MRRSALICNFAAKPLQNVCALMVQMEVFDTGDLHIDVQIKRKSKLGIACRITRILFTSSVCLVSLSTCIFYLSLLASCICHLATSHCFLFLFLIFSSFLSLPLLASSFLSLISSPLLAFPFLSQPLVSS